MSLNRTRSCQNFIDVLGVYITARILYFFLRFLVSKISRTKSLHLRQYVVPW